MTTEKKPTAAQRKKMKGRFQHDETGECDYIRPRHRWMFLFDDGSTQLVTSDRDDSDLRADLLIEFGQERIAGVADLGVIENGT